MRDYSFGNYICSLRMNLGLSQFQLGNLVGVTDKAVSKWENGNAKPRIATCYRLAEVLGVPIDELLSCKVHTSSIKREGLEALGVSFWNHAFERLSSVYGENPSAVCLSRLAAEKAAFYKTDAPQSFAVLGMIQEAAEERNALFFADGTCSASFASWLYGATMVNPLPPHYRCPKCGYTEFVPNIADGFDLPQKACTCGAELIKDGHDIPFDAFARLERYATNVEIRTSDEFEPVAAEIIKSFYAGKADLLPVQMTSEGQLYNMKRYVVMTGDKPKPALSEDGFWHVDAQEYWDWEDTETTFTIYTSAQINRIQQFYEKTEVRFLAPVTLATETMARRLYQRHTNRWAYIAQCLDEGERQDFDLILRLEGLCSSSGGWNLRTWNGDLISSNGEALFKEGRVQFREIPAFRENIWHDISRALARNGIRDNGLALEVMEMARKGKYQKNGVPEKIRHALLSLGLPDWYTDYLGKVMYLFPKGHCVSLLLIDMVYEWYCMNYPEEAQDA